MNAEKIHFIITGGTIDSHYDGTKDTVVPNEHSIIPRYLENLLLYEPVSFDVVAMKDSRDINKQDREKIAAIIEERD